MDNEQKNEQIVLTIEEIKNLAKTILETKLSIEKANSVLSSAQRTLGEDQQKEGSLLTNLNFINIDGDFWQFKFDRDGDFEGIKKTSYLIIN